MDFFRKMIVAANWKMNTNIPEGQKLLEEIMASMPADFPCRVIVAPPFTHLQMVIRNIGDKKIGVAAQNCHYETSGAFTGEVSAGMIKSLGAEFVIVGHSERRHLFHETSEIIKKKVDTVLAAGLKPIFCCGEPLDIRESETHNAYVRMQLEQSIFHLDEDAFKKLIIAYEPIWAIGTGMTATPEQTQEMHSYIRDQIAIHYNKIVSEEIHILYGGSIKPDNARDIFTQSDVDGGLVGGASLNAKGFLEIINATC